MAEKPTIDHRTEELSVNIAGPLGGIFKNREFARMGADAMSANFSVDSLKCDAGRQNAAQR
jgi:hypothetical protein